MKKKVTFAGWSGGHDRWLDPTGIAHAQVVPEGSNQCKNACGSKARTYGSSYKTADEATSRSPGYRTACQRCVAAVKTLDPNLKLKKEA